MYRQSMIAFCAAALQIFRFANGVPLQETIDTGFIADTAVFCLPEVRIQIPPRPMSICLNQMRPGKDSCVEVIINGDGYFNAYIHFFYMDGREWNYSGMTRFDSNKPLPDFRIELTHGPKGNLARASFVTNNHIDTVTPLPHLHNSVNDLPLQPDTCHAAVLNVLRRAYVCRPEYRVLVEERVYTYPPGFRRDPVLNYPELSIFHYGMSVYIPTAYSLENRAQLSIYWHILKLPELEYDDPYKIKNAAAANHQKGKQRKPRMNKRKASVIFFRPLNGH